MNKLVVKRRFSILCVLLAMVFASSFLLFACGDSKTPEVGETYSVAFITNCAESIPTQRVPAGGKVKRPPDPSNGGMVLEGWYTSPQFDSGKKWNFDTSTVEGPTVLYAKWVKKSESGGNESGGNGEGGDNGGGGNNEGGGNGEGGDNGGGNNDGKVTVTFNVGLDARKSGLSNPPAQTVNSGSKVTAPQITRKGYTLSGWYAEDSGSTAWNFNSNTVSQNTTLFARWTIGSSGTQYTPTMTDNNTLYIHYLRSAGDYDGWCLWVWGTGSGTRYTPITKDKSGAVYKISISSASTAVNFKPGIIDENNKWGVSDGGDCSVVPSNAQKVGGSYHWYVREGNTGNGTAYFVDDVVNDDVKTEPLRASKGDVVRSEAAALPVASTVSGWDEAGVGYQIFVASFCDSDGDGVGDIRGIIQKLDYLESLNVDVLWLTPVQSSNSYHGYDCFDYYCIDEKFGTNADYRELVFKAHKKGMKIIMDLVVNHTSPNNEWFIKSKKGVVETVTYQDGTTAEVKYRDFYRWSQSSGNRKYDGGNGWYFYSSFGSNMPELNYDCKAVRRAMADVAAYWMNYGLDGFRMDAIKHVFMNDESENAGSDRIVGDSGWQYNLDKNVEFFKEFNYTLKKKYPHCYLLGEQLDGNASNVAPFYAGMDSLFDFNTYYNMSDRIKSGNVSEAASTLNSNASMYAQYRKDRPINSMISSNHDIPRLSSKLSTEQSKLYFAILMTMPGLSWIYYGDEIGLIGPSGSDNNYRQSMKWTSNWQYECHNAISKKDLNSATVSVADQLTDNNSLLNYVIKLTKLRNDYPVLTSGTATCSTQDGMLKISVTNGTQTLTVYHNFSSNTKTVGGTPVFGTNSVGAYGTTVVK
ncbi:MAG: InlB B-repeat-containing protein [Clostridiales bacterium]|nr:InlB B-repeat-containing protein [Clostridiales bacterium]